MASCAWEAFWPAGFLCPGLPTCAQFATLSLGNEVGELQNYKGVPPCLIQIYWPRQASLHSKILICASLIAVDASGCQLPILRAHWVTLSLHACLSFISVTSTSLLET